MWKWLKRSCLLVKWLLLLAGAGLVVCDAYLELFGLPGPGIGRFEAAAARQGLPVSIARLRLGVIRGIVIDGGELRLHGETEERLFEADRIRLSFAMGALVQGQMRLHSVRIVNGALHLPDPQATETDNLALPAITRINATLRFRARELILKECAAVVEGISVDLSGTLDALPSRGTERPVTLAPDGYYLCRVLDLVRDRGHDHAAPVDLESAVRSFLASHTAVLDRAVDIARNCHLNEKDAQVTVRAELNLSDPARNSITGRFLLSDVILRNVGLRTLTGTFTGTSANWQIRNLSLLVSRDEIVKGNLVFHRQDTTITGTAEGRLTPQLVFRLLGRKPPAVMDLVDLENPVAFRVAFGPSPMDPKRFAAELEVEMERFRWRGLAVDSLSANVRLADGAVILDPFHLGLENSETEESLRGRLQIWPDRRRAAAAVQGRLNLLKTAAALGCNVPTPWTGLHREGKPAEITLTLEESPYNWRQWRGRAHIRLDRPHYERWRAETVRSKLEFAPGQLTLSDFRLDWDNAGRDDIVGRAVLHHAQEPESHAPVRADFELRLNHAAAPRFGSPQGPDEPRQDHSLLQGQLTFAPETRTVKGQVDASLYPKRLYAALRAPLQLPQSRVLSRTACRGAPLRTTLELAETAWPPQNWLVDGYLAVENATYGGLAVKTLQAQVAIRPDRVRITSIKARTAADATIELDLEVGLDPVELALSNGRVRGDPGIVAVFIENDIGKRIYRRIWRDFEWAPGSPPLLLLPRLAFRYDAQAAQWKLGMDSRLDVENATYRHFKTSRINLDVRLALPGLVAIENIVVTKDATEARGDVRIRTSGLPACEFAFPEIKGGCDPRVVLRIINPEWEKYLESFTFDPYSKVECRGSFFLDNEPRLRLEGKLDTAVCTYRGIELRDVQADWQVNGATTSWNVKQAGLYGGTAGVSGFFDATTRSGLVAVNAQAVNLPGLLQVFGLGTDSTREGKLTANCRLQVLKDWAGTPLQLNGNGYLRLSEGNIWAVPFFDQLGQLLKVSGLGRISTLDADLDFRGERVVVPTLKTNGTIIALEGRGEYSWTTEALAFRVWGETLRKIPVLSFALKPMSWVFDAELTGTVKDHRWRLRNALDRVLSRDAVLSNGEQ